MEPKYISLGSTCEVAHSLKSCGIRKEGYPFDYITTIDCHKFITILDTNFEHFIDDRHLVPAKVDPFPLYNTYYNIEILHEGVFNTEGYDRNMTLFKEKYMRRIERFRLLNEYGGKVVFLRHAYKYSVTDPHRIYQCADNIRIDDAYATELYASLKRFFDKLDFTLIILNNHEGSFIEERRIHDKLIFCLNDPSKELVAKGNAYKEYLDTLV